MLAVEDRAGRPLRAHVETTTTTGACRGCGSRACPKDRSPVLLADLAVFGRLPVLVWHKRRWRCLSTASLLSSVVAYGMPLADDPARIGTATTPGLGETLVKRACR